MPHSRSSIASGQARAFAYLIDACAAALLLIPAAYWTYAFGTASAGAVEFSILLFAFHAFHLRFRSGCSLGKHILNICVVSATGNALSFTQCLIRPALIALPWMLIGIADNPLLRPQNTEFPLAPFATIGVLLLLTDVFLMEYSVSRRSLTDMVTKTLVKALPPPEPHRAPAAPMYSENDAEFGYPPNHPDDRVRRSAA